MVRTNDPFDQVDRNNAPDVEERILLDRVSDPYYQKTIDWFFRTVLPKALPESALEVGSGTGHLLEDLRHRLSNNARAVGVDLSEHLVRGASRRFPGCSFQQADGRELPFVADSFDFTYAATVLVHAPYPQRLIEQAVRVTRSGGYVAVLDQDFESAVLYPGDRALTRRVLNAACDFWEDGWIGRKLPAYFHAAGLVDIEVDAHVRIDRTFNSGFFRRIRDWVIEKGFPADEANAWFAALNEAPAQQFFYSRNFYAVRGRKR